jgi:hypothetical protein
MATLQKKSRKRPRRTEELATPEELEREMARFNDLLWKEIGKVPKLRRKLDQYPEFHLVSGVFLTAVQCCSLEFRITRDEHAQLDSGGMPRMIGHFLRLPEDVGIEMTGIVRSIGAFDASESVMLPLKIGGIEAFDAPRDRLPERRS